MLYEYCANTDPGRKRLNNEDAVALDPAVGLAILADGMGGYSAGEVASRIATASILFEMKRWLLQAGDTPELGEIEQAMHHCVQVANETILGAVKTYPPYTGMGTTLVFGVFHNSNLILGHIGDSRCYRLRDKQLTQLTKDHSVVQLQLDTGLITPEQAAKSKNQNLITHALGVEEDVPLEVHVHTAQAGDLYLMCSDGLSDMIDNAEIARNLLRHGSLEQRSRYLINAANIRGGRDNISVLLTQTNQVPQKGWISRMLRI